MYLITGAIAIYGKAGTDNSRIHQLSAFLLANARTDPSSNLLEPVNYTRRRLPTARGQAASGKLTHPCMSGRGTHIAAPPICVRAKVLGCHLPKL